MNKYITTSIPYVNGPPHLGHAMEFVMADVLARYFRGSNETFLSIGTDEHGGKVAKKASEEGLNPQKYVDKISGQFQELAKRLNISNDRFIRTTSNDHKQRVQKIWPVIKDDIYKSTYIGWYCTGDEAFFTETVVKANNGICPNHNIPYEKIEEENYFFRLSKYSSQIEQAISSNKFKIMPETRKNEIQSTIKEGLEDISISRPKKKVSWGIEVPNDPTQTIYVWFEALLNYLTVIEYPEGGNFKDFWPPEYQVVGKDILRFHAAIFPATLLALKLPLAKHLYVHGFINIDGRKMSKSLGNYIEPSEILDKYGTDTYRYFFLRHIPSYDDGDFSWERIDEAYQKELANELGNALQRTVVMVKNYKNSNLPPVETSDSWNVNDLIESCSFDRALDQIWLHIRELNQYIDDKKPWQLHKQSSDQLFEVLDEQISQLRTIGRQLTPFLPETAAKINQAIGGEQLIDSVTTLFPRLG